MKATEVVRRRVVLAEDAFAEIVVWKLDEPLTGSAHACKYRVAYVVAGECVVRYDNERGKGDHRHYGTREATYAFGTPEQLLANFARDIVRWNRENRRS